MKVTLLLNSDFGIQHTVGFRATHIGKNLTKTNNLQKIVCRDYKKNILSDSYFQTIYPPNGKLGKRIPQAFTFAGIMCRPIETLANKARSKAFEFFARTKVKQTDILHTWDFSQKITKKAKHKGAIVIQDVPIAINTITKDFHKTDREYPVPIPDTNAINTAKQADHIIAPSPFVRDSLTEEGVDEKKISIVPFGVDTKRFQPTTSKRKKFTVVFAGNITVRKGVTYLIQAWKQLRLKDAQLILYGRVYPEIKPLLKNQEEYNIATPGFVDLAKELPKAHVCCFPSCLEGSAKAVYEAMASGLPVITTYNAGSIIRDNEEGFIIPIMDVKAIKEKIQYLYENQEEAKKIGQRARILAEQYTWQRYADSVIKIYREVYNNVRHTRV